MSKVITFSRNFPAYHPKRGQQTLFVEKFWSSIYDEYSDSKEFRDLYPSFNFALHKLEPKHHTIRAGNRWKVGDKFSPRFWSGKPYRSHQICIAPTILIKEVYRFEISINDGYAFSQIEIDGKRVGETEMKIVAKNDGLNYEDLLAWFQFPKPFQGQIICWNENIKY